MECDIDRPSRPPSIHRGHVGYGLEGFKETIGEERLDAPNAGDFDGIIDVADDAHPPVRNRS